MSIYKEMGYKDRSDYLKSLSKDYGVGLRTVRLLADMLGEDEDFDGLISELEDAVE